jgi:uncharacterized membrane protein YgcG
MVETGGWATLPAMTSLNHRSLFTAAIIGAASLLVGCSDDHHGPPTMSISVAPTDVLAGDSVKLSVTVTNFELVAVGGMHHDMAGGDDHGDDHDDDEVQQGHYHVYLDSTDGTEPILMAGMPEVDVAIDATPGSHTLIVRLQDLTHRTIEPEVTDEATINVMAPAGTGGGGGAGTGGGSGTGGSGTGGSGGG